MIDTSDWTPQDWEMYEHDAEVQEIKREMKEHETLEGMLDFTGE